MSTTPAAAQTGARPTCHPVTRSAAGLLGGVFDGLARLRQGKPIHTAGSVHPARIQRYGSRRRWGVPWLDEPGTQTVIVRFSRAVGLPPPLPDVLGLALRFTGEHGARHDLLLSTTGFGRGTRHLMLPRRDPARATYTTLLPYRAGDLRVLLMARPLRRPAGATTPDPAALRFVLAASTASSGWEPFGVVTLLPRPDGGLATPAAVDAPDERVSFDPVRHPLPGLRLPDPLATLRAASYRAARRGRHSEPAELAVRSWPEIPS